MLVLLSSCLLSNATVGLAQTDFNIQASSSDLKTEYQKELDKWMLRAYGGDRDAQFKVGVLFANDQFGSADFEQSSYWYTQAARQGHVLAQYNLGHQHLTGNGVKRDEEAAMQWWLKAAEQQHALSQFNIGRAYYLGIGLKKDLSLAKLWFERASQNNEPKSTEILKQLGWWDETSVATVSQPASTSIDDVIELPKNNIKGAAPTQVKSAAGKNRANPGWSGDLSLTKQNARSETPETSISITASNSKPESEPESEPATTTQKTVAEQGAGNASTAAPKASSTQPTPTPPQDTASIAVFTDPAIRSVLITILEDANALEVVSEDDKWTIIRSKEGLPAWVSKNFIRVNGANGIVTGNSVNVRSVPLITTGSIVGRLNKSERITILDTRKDWYRIRSPKRFRGWVKSSELILANPSIAASAPTETQQAKRSAIKIGDLPQLRSKNNDNQWLFSRSKTQYTLQLASFNDPHLLARYVDTLPFKGSKDLKLFTARNDEGVDWTYVLYGTYLDDEVAKTARRELNQKRAWVRRFGILQQNRCLGWKKELPAPKELNQFCI